MEYKVVVFGVKSTTYQVVEYLHRNHYDIDLLVTIDEDVTRRNEICGYSKMDQLAKEYKIELYKTKAYGLDDEVSIAFFEENSFDIGISTGWQRLIPEKILERFRYGVFGLHGSCGYLPYGRGRSTLNWSLVNGDTRFVMNLFQLDKEADSPNIFSRQVFEITPYDTIQTLQYKNILSAQVLLKGLLEAYRNEKIFVSRESKDPDFWYGKRTAEDGKISFQKKTREIYNLVRAVTHPFPGAFAFLNGEKIKLWKAYPFEQIMDFSEYQPGEIIDIFDNNLIIRTIDGSLIVSEYETPVELRRGMVLKDE